MSENTASPADRFLIRAALAGTGNPDALQNVNTAVLPNGSTCYVTSESALWVLDKTSAAGTVAGQSLAAMGGGTWFLLSTAEGRVPGALLLSSAYNTFAVGGNWGLSTSAFFALQDASSSWVLTALGGILTYAGPTRDFSVTLAGAARVGNAGSPRPVFLGISRNNDLTGAPSFGTSGAIDTTLATANSDGSITTVRKVTLASGDTLRAKMAGETAAVELSAVLRMMVTPA